MSEEKKAILYRIETKQHICPFGLKSKALLRGIGFKVEDHKIRTKADADKFKEKYNVTTTPQTFIDGKRIGGFEELCVYFGLKKSNAKNNVSYMPVIAVFVVALLMAMTTCRAFKGEFLTVMIVELFVAYSMCILAMLKLQDMSSFTNRFLSYDLLAQRFVPYAYLYPFVELFAGLCMIVIAYIYIAAPAALIIGGIGTASVVKAVFIEKRKLKCACVGGSTNVPLGVLSLIENLMMVGISLWMLMKLV